MLSNDVAILRETRLRIRHNLIAISGAALNQIDRVFSHPVALAQCRKFLSDHPKMESFAFYDTAGSVKQLVELRDRHAAAIASAEAASYYGAQILQADIEDNPENFTRFFFLRRAAEVQPNPYANKMSLAFTVENRVGTLVAALSELAKEGTNLTKNRVTPGAWPALGVCVLRRLPAQHAGRRRPRDCRAQPALLDGERIGPLRGSRAMIVAAAAATSE